MFFRNVYSFNKFMNKIRNIINQLPLHLLHKLVNPLLVHIICGFFTFYFCDFLLCCILHIPEDFTIYVVVLPFSKNNSLSEGQHTSMDELNLL